MKQLTDLNLDTLHWVNCIKLNIFNFLHCYYLKNNNDK